MAFNVRVEKKNKFENTSCFQLKIEFVLMDNSVYTAIIPMAVEMEGTLSVHQCKGKFKNIYLYPQHKEALGMLG
jgi:hypothetical protein